MVVDVSVTEANLNNASFQWGCNLATHCSVFVQLCLRKAHLFSGVEGRIQSVTEAKWEGLGAGPRRALTILNWRCIMAKQSFVSFADSVLLQVLKIKWHCCSEDDMTYNKNPKRFELYFDATSYSKDNDNSIAHKLADMAQSVGAILSSVSSTQCRRSFF